MSKILIGIDLDGVILLEDRVKYYEAKSSGVSALRNYYDNLKPDYDLLKELVRHWPDFQYNIYTARKWDLTDLKERTLYQLKELDIKRLFNKIVFTTFRYKVPEVLYDGCAAMIDNDYDNLSKIPFIKRYAYKPYISNSYNNLIQFNTSILTNPKHLMDKVSKDLL